MLFRSNASKPADPTRDGYSFKEWTLNGAAYDFDSAVTSDITLKAAWTKNPAPTPAEPDKNEIDELLKENGLSAMNEEAKKAVTEELTKEPEATKKVLEDLSKSGFSENDISKLTADEIKSAVENKADEMNDAKEEAQNNKVKDPTEPAGTDLIDKSDTASDALKKANEKLSVKPKVVEPTPLSESDVQKVKDKLEGLIDPDKLMPSSYLHINTTEEDKDLSKQAERIENLFKLIAKALANVINTAFGKIEAVTAASSASDKGLVIATLLPEMTVDADGYYPMEVNLRNLMPGRVLSFWPSADYLKQYAAGEVKKYDAYFLDENNEVVTKVSGNAAKMKVVPFLEKGKTYDTAFIAVNATTDDLAALEAYNSTVSPDVKPSSNPSGGCDSGFGALALAVVLPAMLRKRRSA